MKNTIAALSILFFAGSSHAAGLTALYGKVIKSLNGTSSQYISKGTVQPIKINVPTKVGGVAVDVAIPAHTFTLRNGMVIEVVDTTLLSQAQTGRRVVLNRVEIQIKSPVISFPKNAAEEKAIADQLIALNKQFQSVDDALNGVVQPTAIDAARGVKSMALKGPKGIGSLTTGDSRMITISKDIDAGQMDEILGNAMRLLSEVTL